MNKKLIGLLLALCLVIGLLPVMSIADTTEATTATVTLWGTAVTVDTDDATTDVPAALYWTNGGEELAPVAATAADNWNYRFTITDGVPTVTLKNAEYSYAASFLYGKYDGQLKLAYEGTNNVLIPYTASGNRYFVSYSATTNEAGKGHIYVEGAANAVLNVTGGGKNSAMFGVSNKAYLTISGGTFNIARTVAGGVNAVISGAYSKTVIENCTLNVKMVDGVGGKHPAVVLGGTKSVAINNADVTIETNAHTGLCVGVFQSNMKGVLYTGTVTVTGDSNIKVITDSNSASNYDYNGVGIYAKTLTVKGGNLEVDAKKQAVYLSATDATPDLTAYTGSYKMYTEKEGAEATAYAVAPYFKVEAAAATPIETTAPATETTAPVQTSAPAVESSAPVQSSAPSVETTAPSNTTAPAETTAPADLAESYTVKIDGVTFTITKYDTPVYSKNTTKTGYFNTVANSEVTNSVSADYIGQVIGGDESDYNAKLIWHTGDEAPTLYLKNLIVDNYNEDLSKWRYSSAANKNYIAYPAIYTGNNAPLKIVLQGGESKFQTYNGIHYQKDLEIVSEGEASLYLWTSRNGIIPSKASSGYANSATHLSGSKLTLNANLTVSLGSYANEDNSSRIIWTKGADMIINGGNIVTEYRGAAKNVSGIVVADSGNLYVNGGSVYAQSYNTINVISAAYYVDGDVYVTGGTLKAYSKHQSGVRANNIYVTGGKVEIESNVAGLIVNGKDNTLSITGGVVEIEAGTRAFAYLYKDDSDKYAQSYKVPTLSANVNVIAGASKDTAEQITDVADYEFKVKYAKVDYTVPAPSNPSNPGGETTAPGGETTAPGGETTAPGGNTTAPSNPGNNPATGDSGVTMFIVMLLVGMFGIVATVAFGKKRAV